MVDFQSRDRDRGRGDDETDESEAAEGEGAESEAAAAAEAANADAVEADDEHAHDHDVDVDDLGIAVVTVSSTRTREDDPSGDAVESIVESAEHRVVTRDVLRDDLDGVQSAVNALADRSDVDVIVTTGGTGVTPDDATIEAVVPLFDKTLPGFGELFRRLSYDEVGTKVVGTRTTAGVVGDALVFCLPGSENAARLGTEEIIVEEMSHLIGLVRRD